MNSANREKQNGKDQRGLFKKIVDTKGNFYTRMGTIKDRSHYHDLTEAEEVKKRWQQYTEVYKNGLNNPDDEVWPVTQSQTSWTSKLNGPLETLL